MLYLSHRASRGATLWGTGLERRLLWNTGARLTKYLTIYHTIILSLS